MSKSITYGPTSDGRFAIASEGMISEFFTDPDAAKKAAMKLSSNAARQYFKIPEPQKPPEEAPKKAASKKKASEPKTE